jgi:hypothetical protein
MARVTRPRDQAPKAEPAQHGTHRPLSQHNAELGLDRADKVGPAPANNVMLGQVRAATYPICYLRLLLRRKQTFRWRL